MDWDCLADPGLGIGVGHRLGDCWIAGLETAGLANPIWIGDRPPPPGLGGLAPISPLLSIPASVPGDEQPREREPRALYVSEHRSMYVPLGFLREIG